MMKKIILIIFLFLSACGYQLVNNFENNNFYIVEYTLDGDKFINRLLSKNFSKTKNTNAEKKFIINTNGKIERNINSKSKSGENVNLTTIVTINFEVLKDNDLIKVLELKDSSTYNASENKFEQKQYERTLIENMVENIIKNLYQTLAEIE